MNITINQDLMEIIDGSNGVFKLHRSAIWGAKKCTIILAAGITISLMTNKCNREYIQYLLILSAFASCSSLLAGKLITTINSNEIKEICINDLNNLIPLLREYGTNTSLELIRQASKVETKYKLSMESFPPKIIQTKTISIPSYSIFPNTKESSIEQQHELGSEQYVLTLGSASKKRKLVPVYNQV